MQDTHGNSLTVAYRGVGGMSDVADNTCTHYQGDPPICTSEIGNVQQWYAVSSYPYKIRYSQNDTGGARRIVRFILSQRSDVPSEVQTWETHKLEAVEMRLSGTPETLVRKYGFGYDTTTDPNQLRLTGVTQYG
ncbi:MAG: hypothetical protein HY331_05435, partial [Chloroflexi bacterium]|nr:hypothetical protein [Chloroflexota bacterium]